ncbi:MAG: hypothetical protein ACPG7F_06260 [Aggregatilineales bacterium]
MIKNDSDFTKITREPDGVISGMTDINYTPDRGHKIFQGLTGVQDHQRGRGLGKWLKANMLLYIRENYPDVEFIETDNAASNDAMLSISMRMGFEVYHHSVMYHLPVTALKSD